MWAWPKYALLVQPKSKQDDDKILQEVLAAVCSTMT